MTFGWPILLLAVLLVPAWLLAARAIDGRRRARLAGLGGLAREAGGGASAGATGRRGAATARASTILVAIAFVILAVALARPAATISTPRIEGTLVLTFDVSASMAADDVAPTRMDVAKAAAKTIVGAQPPGVVVGVVAFSDAGLAVQTPTSDEAAVLAAIVLFSDGENNERPDPMGAARQAADLGIRIVTIGVGTTAGATLDLDGFRVQSALDEDALRNVADLTAGTYEPAASVTPGAVYDQLSRHLVLRDESLELTALFGAAGLILLLVATVASLARSGRLP